MKLATENVNPVPNTEEARKTRSYFRARRTEYSDIAELQILSEERCNKDTFGNQILNQLMEHSLVSVTVIEQTKRFEHMTGYACFNDIPTRVLASQTNWSDVLQRSLPRSYFSTANSVFLNALITEPRNSKEILEECLKVLFTVNPELDYCLRLAPSSDAPDSLFQKYFPAWIEFMGDDGLAIRLSICQKGYVYPELTIREAGVADVPRALPYFTKLHNRLRGHLGEDWLEKIVCASSTSKDTKCCVVEDPKGLMCGFFCVTSANIDREYLDFHYETRIFHQFLRITDFDRIADRLSNYDVELGTTNPEEDLVFDRRGSIPSVPELPELEISRKKHKTRVHPGDKRDESTEEERSFTPSVERYIADLIDGFGKMSVEDVDEEEHKHRTTESELEDNNVGVLTDLPVTSNASFMLADQQRSLVQATSVTASFLISAKTIVSQLFTDKFSDYQHITESALTEPRQSISSARVSLDPRTVDQPGLASRAATVTEYAQKLDGVLARLYAAVQQHGNKVDDSVSPAQADFQDVLQDLLGVLEANAMRMLELESGSTSTANFSKLGEVSRTTVTAVESLLQDIEKIAYLRIDKEEQGRRKVPTTAGEDARSTLTTGVPREFLQVPQIQDGPIPQIPIQPSLLARGTLTTLQLLICQLEQENKNIAQEQFMVYEMQMRLTSRQFNISYPPISFPLEEGIMVPGEYQIKSTNIVGLCPVSERLPSRGSHEGVSSAGDMSHRKAATTARLSELAFGLNDLVRGINFAVKKADVPVYGSESDLPMEDEGMDDGKSRPKKKLLPPVEFETPDQVLERVFRKQYGLVESATEPMFNSWDELLRVPQPFIPTVREEPGIRTLQRKANKFFQNPILGRAGEFNYVLANGEQNGMYLLLFHLDELHSTYLDRLLTHCFHVLPGFDYLLTQIPTADHHSMLLTKLMRAALRPGHYLREDLFVLHVTSLLRCGDLEFMKGLPNDVHPMSQYLDGKADGHAILSAFSEAVHFHNNLEALKLKPVVIRVAGAIVGVLIFTQETELEYLLAHYNVDDFLCTSQHHENGHMRILHYTINPTLDWMNQFVLQEVMRLFGYSSVFYRFFQLKKQVERKDSFPCCLDRMKLVRPRAVLEFPGSANWKLLPSSVAMNKQEPFALYHTNRRLLLDVRTPVIDRIVIVGASDMSLQVLRNLILYPHLRFTNIILVDPHGVAAINQTDGDSTTFCASRSLYSTRELHQLAIPAHCQILYGRAITMDKTQRLLHVNDKVRIPFDYMIIGTGQQFLTFNINVDTDWISNMSSGDPDRQLADYPRRTLQQTHSYLNNYFAINNAYEADSALSKLEGLRENPQSRGYFVIYGASLEAYGCVYNLMKLGINPDEVLFVNPAPAFPESQAVFSTMDLEAWVKNLLFTHGIVVIMEWIAVAYNEGEGGNTINTVTFWTDEAAFKTYHVQAFFNFTHRQMNPFTYTFLNSSYLIVDKKLVIDEKFRAYAPQILAGGSCCKYPRRFFVSNFDFASVNSREIGDLISWELMGVVSPEMFRKKVDRDMDENNRENSAMTFPTLPKFHRPLVDSVNLPFGWHYCNIRSPQSPVAGRSAANVCCEASFGSHKKSAFGKEERRLISTGSIADGNLFEIYLDKLHIIDEITCVTRFALKVESLIILHGMQEGWLELVQRFEDGYIKDFFEYIRELWMSCVFYDRFPMLSGELRRLLLDDQGDGNNLSVIETINQCFKNQELAQTSNNLLYEEIVRRIRSTGIKFDVVETIENFLENNSRHLPMYTIKTNQGEDLPVIVPD